MDKERKIYTSFHDIPPREYMYFPRGTIEQGKPGKFSRIELSHLIISMGVLTLSFALVISGNSLLNGFRNIDLLPMGLLFSSLGIFTAFFFHEMSHKFMAQRYGLWAEYRMFPMGLLLAVFLALFTGFVFAAPGAVMFRGSSRGFETGRIAMAGPLANIIIAGVCFILYSFVFFETDFASIFGFIFFINAFLATFNLIPFGPLDGIKIIRWNINIWIVMFISAVFLMVLSFQRISGVGFF